MLLTVIILLGFASSQIWIPCPIFDKITFYWIDLFNFSFPSLTDVLRLSNARDEWKFHWQFRISRWWVHRVRHECQVSQSAIALVSSHFLTLCSTLCSRGMRKLNNVNLLMQTDDSTKQAIFDSVCEQRIKRFGRLVGRLIIVDLCIILSPQQWPGGPGRPLGGQDGRDLLQ